MHEVAEDAHVFHRPQKLPVSRKVVKGSRSITGKSKVAEGKRNKGVEMNPQAVIVIMRLI